MADDLSDMIRAARSRTLAHNDPRLQKLERQAAQGSSQAQRDLDAINRAGGASRGDVNRII